ncbi:MAG: MBL fold metallo-hydrolase [Deltaproteobacteria bacterium]|nr:MBL fold metallo-hydrolase [Deltaproteobacteria bacterium]MCW5800916.1 MBL fold metallo-hydrolase [Deltaproteobacteria bacterium]
MKIRFWGVRGSIPAPGPDTIRYGGNTSCVSVETRTGGLVVIDMGTGLMHLGNHLMTGAFGKGQGRASILLSHTHWDHIQGLGFFPPVFVAGNQFTVWGPGGSPEVLEGILEGQMDPNFSPLQTLKNFSATFDVRAVRCGLPFDAEGLRVTCREHPHGSATALAFRIDDGTRTFVYASDVGQPDAGAPPHPDAIAFYQGADVLLHDTTYRPEDQATRRNRGFSSYEDAADAAIAARVGKLVMFHYDQDYSDADVDELLASCRATLDARGGAAIGLVPAREGEELEI